MTAIVHPACRASSLGASGAALGQPVQHPPLLRQDAVHLGFGFVGPDDQLDGLETGAALHGRRQNRLEHLADRCHVGPAHPERQVQQVLREQRLRVHRFEDLFDLLEVGFFDAADHPADRFAVAPPERDAHPLTRMNLAAQALRQPVGKRPVQADRKGHRDERRRGGTGNVAGIRFRRCHNRMVLGGSNGNCASCR